MSFFFLTLFVAFVIFVRVYGPSLLAEFLADWEAKQQAEHLARFEAMSTIPTPEALAIINAKLWLAFGDADTSRPLEDCTPYEWLDVQEFDSELEQILCDESLSTDQAIVALDELLNREMAART